MKKIIYTSILLVTAFTTTSAWAGDNAHKSGKIHLNCVQTDSNHAKNKDAKIHLECVQTKDSSNHKYHDATDNPED